MKFLHCSDIHLGRKPAGGIGEYSSKRYNDYFQAFDYAAGIAISSLADVFIVTGDLFDKKELMPEVLEKTEVILEKLRKNAIEVVAIEGNHDNIIGGREPESWIIYLENKGLLHRPYMAFEEGEYRFHPVTIKGIDFYGLGYPGSFVNEAVNSLADRLTGTDAGKNVVLIHTAPASADLLPGTVDYESIDKLKGKAMYTGGGHFHSFSAYPGDNPFFFIPGSTECWENSEYGQRKGMILFDTDTKEWEFIPSRRRNIIHNVFMHNSENQISFFDEFRLFTDSLEIRKDEDIVLVDIVHNNSFYIDTASCEEMIKAAGALKATARLLHGDIDVERQLARSNAGVGEIERDVIAGWEYYSAHTDRTAEALTKMKKFFEEEQYDTVHEIFDNFLDTVINRGGSDEN